MPNQRRWQPTESNIQREDQPNPISAYAVTSDNGKTEQNLISNEKTNQIQIQPMH